MEEKFIDSAFEEESKRNNNNRSNSGASGSSLSTDRIYTAFSDHGVVELCMDLMTPGIEADLALGAMRVLIALLMKAGGNAVIQIAVYNYLKNRDSTLFFEYLREIIGRNYF